MRRITQALIGLTLLVGLNGAAQANEFTDVIDAFDDQIGDPFDLNLRVGYERFQKSGLIRREVYIPRQDELHSWDYFAYRNMFNYKQVTHTLNMDLDIGLFKDIALRARVPLILNDSRELKAHDDIASLGADGWNDVDGDGQGDELFVLPFKSPERSGLDYFAVGLWWGILAQDRDDTKPNWTIFAEGRFGVGKTLEAACYESGTTPCKTDPTLNHKGGISRGLNELAFGTRLSRRYGLFDPYFGFEALIGWPKEGTSFKIMDRAVGQINDMPPVVGTLDFGLELVPWEVPEDYRKFVIGIGGGGKYHSEGREYTPLFDALGLVENGDFPTSMYPEGKGYIDFNGNGQNDGAGGTGDVADETAALDSWSGMTDVENYATFYGRLYFMIQPAKYIKFKLGTDLGHETEHFITKTDQCPSENRQGDGTCYPYNWGHRPYIDTPGNRFRVEQTLIWTFFVDAIAMF